MKQLKLFATPLPVFGGELVPAGKRKSARPLAAARPVHLIFKAQRILLSERIWLHSQLYMWGAKFRVKIYALAIAGDHLHIVIKFLDRTGYRAFVRAFAAQATTRLGAKLWKGLPFTRVANWGRDFKCLIRYVLQNQEETDLMRAYVPRGKDRYKKLRPA